MVRLIYRLLERARTDSLDLMFTFLYFWCGVIFTLPARVVDSEFTRILTLYNPSVAAILYYILFISALFTVYEDSRTVLKYFRAFNAAFMFYVAGLVYISTGISLGMGVFIALGLSAMLTLWGATINERRINLPVAREPHPVPKP